MKMPVGFNGYLNADNILGQLYKNCKLKITSWTVGRCSSAISAESNKSYYSITYYGIKQFISLLATSLKNIQYITW